MEPEKISVTKKIDILMKEVIEDAEVKAEIKIREAEEKSRKILQEVTKNLENEVKDIFENMNEKIEKERKIKLIEIQTKIRNEIMIAKDEKINIVLSLIEKKLLDFVNNARYKSFLLGIFKNMLNYLSPGEYILFFNEQDYRKISDADIKKINQNTNLNFIISQEHIKRHGIVLKSKNQKIILEDTLEGRFNKKKEMLRCKIGNLLFNN